MESEKVKEIKKALDCIVNANAPQIELNYYGNLHLDILTLINELESENERLQEQNGALSCDLDYINEKLTNAEIEVDDYKDRIALLEKDNELLRNAKVVYENVDYCYEDLKKAEKRIAELEKENEKQLKQFAERLKDKLKDNVNGANVDYYVECAKFMGETVKEFLDDKNAEH